MAHPVLDDRAAAVQVTPVVSQEADDRERALATWLRERGRVLVGYSGGVDSAYLAAVAVQCLEPGAVLAVIGRSASYPEAQWQTARTVADKLGLQVLEVETAELGDPRYIANPSDRCYYCKSELWSRLAPLGAARAMTVVDGTNADDLSDWRPGARAAREYGVRSPLAELGFTKAEVRALSARLGLPTWSQPSAPCLASRIPYGTPVTTERLAQVEAAEAALRRSGVRGDLRVRHHGAIARVELSQSELDAWLAPDRHRVLADAIRAVGFERVALDLRGFRSGSLNVLVGIAGGPHE
jgi:pyridinium-3,5-biscarboxylic acid mononucleotide sulfurtransferase